MRAPIVNYVSEDIKLEIPHMQFTPQPLKLEVSEELIGETLVFPQIPYHDTQFLKIEKGNGIFIEEMGKTALRIEGPGPILMQARNNPFIFAVIIGVIGWIGIGGLNIRSERIRKEK